MLPVWNLEGILKAEKLPDYLEDIRESIDSLEKTRDEFVPEIPAEKFKEIMDSVELLSRKMGRISSYASNKFAENANNQDALALQNQIAALNVEQSTKLLFISQNWKQFDEKNAQRLMKACPEYEYHLRLMYEGRKHMLSDKEEELIEVKDLNGTEALNKIYDLITNTFTFDFEGKKCTVADMQESWFSEDRKRRKEGYAAFFKPFEENKNVLGTIYLSIIDDWRREAKLRKHKNSIAVRNHANDIPDEVIDTFLEVCRKNATVFQAYFKKKADMLGLKDFARYDLYAPLEKKDANIPFEEAKETVLKVFEGFHPQFLAGAKKIIDENHIHAQPQKGKDTGAYCNTPEPAVTPYILLNYTGTLNNVSTLAHELGHGIHSILSSHHNNFHNHAPMPIAETASIFSELLLEEYLKKEKPELAKSLAMTQLDGFYASIMRQAWFVIYEQTAHDMVKDNPTIDALTNTYMDQLKEHFGDIDIPEGFKYEWMYIQHIFKWPFYCYAYSFGNLLSLALYDQYKKDPGFADTVVDFLSKGGSESPYDMVKETGFDISDPEFWQGGFDVIHRMIDEL